MNKINDSTSAAVTQNTISSFKQSAPAGVASGGQNAFDVKPAADAAAETVEIAHSRRSQLESANALIRELKQSQFTLQVGVSALQEIEEGLQQKNRGKLEEAGDKALRLMESVGRANVDKDIESIRKKLAKEEPMSFADVMDAVAVLAKVAKNSTESSSVEEVKMLADAVSLVNQALTKAQVRLDTLTETANKANSKVSKDTETREGLEKMNKGLLAAMQNSRQDALKAQANINPDFVSKVLQSDDFKSV